MSKIPKSTKIPKVPLWKKGIVAAASIGLIAGTVTTAKRIIDPGEIVTEVIDGDTFRIGNKQTIRIYGVDSPELTKCFGKESHDALNKKILGKKVILKSPRTDYFRRVEAYVYLDGEFINEFLAKNGYGADHSDGAVESKLIKEAGNFAQTNRIGIYSEKCYPLTPPKNNCLVKGHIPYNTKEKRYLIPGCNSYEKAIVERYRGEDWFCTEQGAVAAGFTKSPNCK